VEILLDRYADAREALDEALGIFRELGDLRGQALAINYLGVLRYAVGEYRDSEDYLGEALALYRSLGDRHGQAEVICDIGRMTVYLGNYESAISALSQARAMYADLGYRRVIASSSASVQAGAGAGRRGIVTAPASLAPLSP